MASSSDAAGLPPNFYDYCGGGVIAVAIVFAILQITVVALRFYARFKWKMRIAADDWMMLPALLGGLGQCALYIVMVKVGGVGYHVEYVATWPGGLVPLEKCLLADELIDFPLSVTPAKLSILLFYRRIFGSQLFINPAIYIIAFIVIGTGAGTFFAGLFQCSPIRYTWDKTVVGGTCINQMAYYRYVSVPNILTDVMILILPLPSVWRLRTTVSQRIGLTGVFALGSIGTIASCFRMSIFFQKNAFVDPTWTSAILGKWTLAEAGLLVIATCLPSLWPLFVGAVPRKPLHTVANKASRIGNRFPSFFPKKPPRRTEDDTVRSGSRYGRPAFFAAGGLGPVLPVSNGRSSIKSETDHPPVTTALWSSHSNPSRPSNGSGSPGVVGDNPVTFSPPDDGASAGRTGDWLVSAEGGPPKTPTLSTKTSHKSFWSGVRPHSAGRKDEQDAHGHAKTESDGSIRLLPGTRKTEIAVGDKVDVDENEIPLNQIGVTKDIQVETCERME